MELIVDGRCLAMDNEGYLLNPEDWDTQVALLIAARENIELSETHWVVIQFIREYLDERQSVPEARHLLKSLAETLGKEKATRKFLYSLFPYGYGQQACKIAGTRKPLKLMLDV